MITPIVGEGERVRVSRMCVMKWSNMRCNWSNLNWHSKHTAVEWRTLAEAEKKNSKQTYSVRMGILFFPLERKSQRENNINRYNGVRLSLGIFHVPFHFHMEFPHFTFHCSFSVFRSGVCARVCVCAPSKTEFVRQCSFSPTKNKISTESCSNESLSNDVCKIAQTGTHVRERKRTKVRAAREPEWNWVDSFIHISQCCTATHSDAIE